MKLWQWSGLIVLLCGTPFGGSCEAAAQEAKRVPIVQEWKGTLQTIALRDLAPRKLFINNAQDWATLWSAWRPNEAVPKVDFTMELILVTTAPGQAQFREVSWREDVVGNLTSRQIVDFDEAPGFVYVIQKVKLGDIRQVNGIFVSGCQ
jgi:hypothetical protein